MLISLPQWAAKYGHTPEAANKLIHRSKLPQAIKIGRNWTIDDSVSWPEDKRYKPHNK